MKEKSIYDACNAFLYDPSGGKSSLFYNKILSFFGTRNMGLNTDLYLLPKLIDNFHNDDHTTQIDSKVLESAISDIRAVYNRLKKPEIIDFLINYKDINKVITEINSEDLPQIILKDDVFLKCIKNNSFKTDTLQNINDYTTALFKLINNFLQKNVNTELSTQDPPKRTNLMDSITIIINILNTSIIDEQKKLSGSILPSSELRHTQALEKMKNYKTECQVVQARLENVKEMVSSLRVKFSENSVVTLYLKPEQPKGATTSSSAASSVLSLEQPLTKSLTTFYDLYQKFKKIVDHFSRLYKNPSLFFIMNEFVENLETESSVDSLTSAKEKITNMYKTYTKTKQTHETKKIESLKPDKSQQDKLLIESDYATNILRAKDDAIKSTQDFTDKILVIKNAAEKYNDNMIKDMGITGVENEKIIFDKTKTFFSDHYTPLIDTYPGFDELLAKMVNIFYNIKKTSSELYDEITKINDNLDKNEGKDKIIQLIDVLSPLPEMLSEAMKNVNDVLLLYKNAFVRLSFQIASTLFGYGVSILQIFMQNFPEQMNTFNEDGLYGLRQLNALKAPFQPFVTARDIETQVFNLSDYASVFTIHQDPTPFNLLLPIENLSSMPLFTKDKIQPASASGGGKKQRRLLPPRPKKRKTIKYKFNTTKKTNKPKKTKKTIKKGNNKRKTSIRKK